MSLDEVSDELKEPRRNILEVFISYDGDAFNTSTLRKRSGVSSHSMNHHLEQLVEWDILEELDERDHPEHGGGSKARQWQLTERGETFVEDYIVYVPPADVEELARRLVDLERELADLREEHDEDVDDLKDRVDDGLDKVIGIVTGEGDNGQRR